jgi:hypothetical protein
MSDIVDSYLQHAFGETKITEYTASTSTIDVDWTAPPGSDAWYKIVDVALKFNTAPTTSENITIGYTTPGTVNYVQDTHDPSTDSETDVIRRFDKQFAAGGTITVDYPNTDGRSISVAIQYVTVRQ